MHTLKLLLTIITFTLLLSCNKSNNKTTEIAFLTDVTTLEKETKNPIKKLISVAKENASKTIAINKDNIKSALQTAKKFKHAVIIVGAHTAVKITDLNNCKASGSWGACMPYAKGYIKKGSLIFKENYINNIIGTPDTQERV